MDFNIHTPRNTLFFFIGFMIVSFFIMLII